MAVGTTVLNILEALRPGIFTCQSDDGDTDVTDDLWLANGCALVSGVHKTKFVVKEADWKDIEDEIEADVEFWWPVDPKETTQKVTRIIGEIYCQLYRWGTDVAFLTTYDCFMAFYKEKTVLRCSKLYHRAACSDPTPCKLLLSLVLAQANRKNKCDIAATFALPKELSDKPSGRSKFGPPSWRVQPVSQPVVLPVFVPPDVMDPEVFKDIFDRRENCPPVTTESLLRTQSIWMHWRTKYVELHEETLMLPVASPDSDCSLGTPSLISSQSTGSQSSSGSSNNESDMFLVMSDHLAFSYMGGHVARGIGSGGLPIVGKLADSCVGADILTQELHNYKLFQEAGLSSYPYLLRHFCGGRVYYPAS